MKKFLKVLLIVLGVIIILGVIFFAVDYNRVKAQEKPIFCINYSTLRDGGTQEYLGLGYKVIDFNMLNGYDEIKIGSWFMKYEDFKEEYDYTNEPDKIDEQDISEVPREYPMEQAIKDGCVVLDYAIFNNNKLNSFIENTKADSENRKDDFVRIVKYTIEGAAMITDIEYQSGVGYILKIDNTRDAFGVDTEIITNRHIPEDVYTIELEENEDSIEIVLKVRENVEGDYSDIIVSSYSKDATIYDTAPSFIGEVTEIYDKSIVVKTEEQNLGDAVSVGVENVEEFDIGDRVEVTYTGIVLESYPCQIYEIDVEKINE